MSTKGDAAQRLGKAVLERRLALDMSQLDVWQSGGPSNTTLTTIENGRLSELTTATARKLDRGLRWRPGTARSIWSAEESAREVGDQEISTDEPEPPGPADPPPAFWVSRHSPIGLDVTPRRFDQMVRSFAANLAMVEDGRRDEATIAAIKQIREFISDEVGLQLLDRFVATIEPLLEPHHNEGGGGEHDRSAPNQKPAPGPADQPGTVIGLPYAADEEEHDIEDEHHDEHP